MLEPRVGYRPPVRERIIRFIFSHPALGYLGTIGFVWALERHQPAGLRPSSRCQQPRSAGRRRWSSCFRSASW